MGPVLQRQHPRGGDSSIGDNTRRSDRQGAASALRAVGTGVAGARKELGEEQRDLDAVAAAIGQRQRLRRWRWRIAGGLLPRLRSVAQTGYSS